MPASHVIQPAQAEPSDTQSTATTQRAMASFVVVEDQQTGPSRLLTFILTPTKHFNPQSLALVTSEESSHNISGLSSFFGNL